MCLLLIGPYFSFILLFFFFSSRRRHTRLTCDWSSDVCSSDLSLGQVASQTLRNLGAVEAVAKLPVFRPLIGTDKIDILATANKIGTYDISSEPFHDCCPVFMPKSPALYASAKDLDEAESKLDVRALVTMGLRETTLQTLRYLGDSVEISEPQPIARAKKSTAIA